MLAGIGTHIQGTEKAERICGYQAKRNQGTPVYSSLGKQGGGWWLKEEDPLLGE